MRLGKSKKKMENNRIKNNKSSLQDESDIKDVKYITAVPRLSR